jgi:hypothetical protein
MVAFVRGAQRLVNSDRIAKRYGAPWLSGIDVVVAIDKRTGGQRIAQIGMRRGDELFIALSVLARGTNALSIAVKVSKG